MVLVVDDDASKWLAVKRVVRKMGHGTEFFLDPEKAITAIFQRGLEGKPPYSFAVIDQNIPCGGRSFLGHVLARKILAVDPEIKLILFTTDRNAAIMQSYQDHGFVAAINEPGELETLHEHGII